MSGYSLERIKRDWVPEWLWWLLSRRLEPFGSLALYAPWKQILTQKMPDGN